MSNSEYTSYVSVYGTISKHEKNHFDNAQNRSFQPHSFTKPSLLPQTPPPSNYETHLVTLFRVLIG